MVVHTDWTDHNHTTDGNTPTTSHPQNNHPPHTTFKRPTSLPNQRSMPPKRSNPRSQYFNAIKQDKLDTVRWCLRHGGISTKAEDDEGKTGIQIAAANGYVGALELLLEHVKRFGTPDEIEESDEDGRTPLMMACHAGKLECVRLLVLNGKASMTAKCEAGKTAKMYAEARKHEKIVAFLNNPTAPPSDDESESDDDEEARKAHVFKASQKAAGQVTAAQQQQEVHAQRVAAAEALEKALASSAPPIWPEVEPILKETRRELSIRNKPALTGASGAVDPAVWNCVCLYELRLELAERALTSLPPQLSRLRDLVTLIVSRNGLTALPDELCTLTKLKNLEAADNSLSALPAGCSQLTSLQVVDVSSNQLTSLAPLSDLTELVAVNAGHNQLVDLPLNWPKLEHMRTLAAPHNAITVFPPGIGSLQMLESLDLSENRIEQVRIGPSYAWQRARAESTHTHAHARSTSIHAHTHKPSRARQARRGLQMMNLPRQVFLVSDLLRIIYSWGDPLLMLQRRAHAHLSKRASPARRARQATMPGDAPPTPQPLNPRPRAALTAAGAHRARRAHGEKVHGMQAQGQSAR